MKTFDVTYHFAGGGSLDIILEAVDTLDARDQAVALGMHHPFVSQPCCDTSRGVESVDGSNAHYINMAQVTHIKVAVPEALQPSVVHTWDPVAKMLRPKAEQGDTRPVAA